MISPFLKRAATAQSLRSANWVRLSPARNGWSATRMAIGSITSSVSMSVFIIESNKLVFFFPNDQYRAGGGPNNPFGGASYAEMFPAGVAVRPDHHQIDVEF